MRNTATLIAYTARENADALLDYVESLISFYASTSLAFKASTSLTIATDAQRRVGQRDYVTIRLTTEADADQTLRDLADMITSDLIGTIAPTIADRVTSLHAAIITGRDLAATVWDRNPITREWIATASFADTLPATAGTKGGI